MIHDLEIILQIVIAAFLGGIVGYEREKLKRPAGLRTHILVCVGSAIAMQTNLFLVDAYINIMNVDASRIGASVVSGIGFLGAGTIIREGASVKGLTTAASLWAVACIGLAIGSGFYLGALTSTLIVFVTLSIFYRLRKRISFRRSNYVLEIITATNPGQLGHVGTVLGNMNTIINDIIIESHTENESLILLSVKPPSDMKIAPIITAISDIEGVRSVALIE